MSKLIIAVLILFVKIASAQILPVKGMSINSDDDIINKRKEITKYIWGKDSLPYKIIPDSIYPVPFNAQKYKNLSRIDGLRFNLPFLFLISYHFIPKIGNGRMMIYHAGHGYGFEWENTLVNDDDIIESFLKDGFSVLAFNMPFQGGATPSYATLPYSLIPFGMWSSISHELMFEYFDQPYRYFFESLVGSINYIQQNYNYDELSMIGLSGGGWETTLYSAIDPRINYSFPVAGSVPLYLREGYEGLGDVEQGYDYDGLYGIAGYKDFYVMGSHGKERGQLQILNEHDNICFYGRRHVFWVDSVKSIVKQLGLGKYEFFLDTTHQSHKISKIALNKIKAFLFKVSRYDALEFSFYIKEEIKSCEEIRLSLPEFPEGFSYQWQKLENTNFSDIDQESFYQGITGNTLIIKSNLVSLDSDIYRCKVKNTFGVEVVSDPFKITTTDHFLIEAQPVNDTINKGSDAVFNIKASPSSFIYQWQVKENDEFLNISNGKLYLNANTPSLTIIGKKYILPKYYRCIVTDYCNNMKISNPVQVYYKNKPDVIVDRIGCLNEVSHLQADLFYEGLELKWEKEIDNTFKYLADSLTYVKGSNTIELDIIPIKAGETRYRYRLSDTALQSPSEIFNVKILEPISFSIDNRNPLIMEEIVKVFPNDSASFMVIANGTDVTYKWYEELDGDYKEIDDSKMIVNSNRLLIKDAVKDYNNKVFRCILQNSCDSLFFDFRLIIRDKAQEGENFHIFPNPMENFLIVSFTVFETEEIKFKIFSSKGSTIFEETKVFQRGDYVYKILPSNLDIRIFYLMIISPKRFKIEKLLKAGD